MSKTPPTPLSLLERVSQDPAGFIAALLEKFPEISIGEKVAELLKEVPQGKRGGPKEEAENITALFLDPTAGNIANITEQTASKEKTILLLLALRKMGQNIDGVFKAEWEALAPLYEQLAKYMAKIPEGSPLEALNDTFAGQTVPTKIASAARNFLNDATDLVNDTARACGVGGRAQG